MFLHRGSFYVCLSELVSYIHVNQKNKIMKKYLAICFNDATDSYVVNDLKKLIEEMYENEMLYGESFEEVSNKFYSYHKVFEINGEIKEIN